MKHFNQEGYLKPKMFDRWREWIRERQRFKYWLQFVEKRAQIIKSDLHAAFDRWKRFHPQRKEALTIESKQELGKRAMGNDKTLDRLAEEINEKENIMDHLNA